jgi:hypothetical protein
LGQKISPGKVERFLTRAKELTTGRAETLETFSDSAKNMTTNRVRKPGKLFDLGQKMGLESLETIVTWAKTLAWSA